MTPTIYKQCKSFTEHLKKNTSQLSSWWFQPILKSISQVGSFPQKGMKIKTIWNHHPALCWNSLQGTRKHITPSEKAGTSWKQKPSFNGFFVVSQEVFWRNKKMSRYPFFIHVYIYISVGTFTQKKSTIHVGKSISYMDLIIYNLLVFLCVFSATFVWVSPPIFFLCEGLLSFHTQHASPPSHRPTRWRHFRPFDKKTRVFQTTKKGFSWFKNSWFSVSS